MLHFVVKLINNRLNFDLSKNNEILSAQLQIVLKYGKYNPAKVLPLPAFFYATCKAISVLERCKIDKYASLSRFADAFFRYQTFLANFKSRIAACDRASNFAKFAYIPA